MENVEKNASEKKISEKKEGDFEGWEKYADIINLPAFKSKIRPSLSSWNRAAQFSPFAALSGFEEAVEKTQETFCDY